MKDEQNHVDYEQIAPCEFWKYCCMKENLSKGMAGSFSIGILNRRELKLLNKYLNSCLINDRKCEN